MQCNCGPKVLVVEDEDMQRMVCVRQLTKNWPGVTIEEAEDGKIAVGKFTEQLNSSCTCDNKFYKLIFMDLLMPNMDGFEASKTIVDLINTNGH